MDLNGVKLLINKMSAPHRVEIDLNDQINKTAIVNLFMLSITKT